MANAWARSESCAIAPAVTVAEFFILIGVLALILWALRPLRKRITRAIERRMNPQRARIIDAKFRVVTPHDPKNDEDKH